jgi:lipopolysaccharide export system permease protein
MKLPWTLSLYISRHFLVGIMLALFALLTITTLIDVVELIRRASGKEMVTFGVVVEMTLLKIPALTDKLMAYAVLIGSMLALSKLTRTHELVVARAAGVSVWQFLAPAMATVMAIGIFMITVFNPFAAALRLRYEQIEAKYFSGKPSLLAISSSGLWLRQIEEGNEHIIHALRISQSDMSFSNLIVFTFGKNSKFVERLDAEHAVLEPGDLHFTDVTRSVPGLPPQSIGDYSLPTSLTLGHIQDSFASPDTMSFWHLPSFISMLEQAGFSALRHRLYWTSLLAQPFLLAGSVLVAAVFSLRLPRHGKLGVLLVAGLLTGFLLHFFTDIIFALGSAGTLPIWLAAWAPAFAIFMVGAALLLHLEDG